MRTGPFGLGGVVRSAQFAVVLGAWLGRAGESLPASVTRQRQASGKSRAQGSQYLCTGSHNLGG